MYVSVLYVITLPSLGGAQTHLWEIISHARGYGIEPMLAVGGRGWLTERSESIGVPTYVVDDLVREISPVHDVKSIYQIKKLINKLNPDIVHCHSSKAGIVGRLAACLAGKKMIFTAHGWAFTEGVSIYKRILYMFIERIVGRMTDKIICVSEYDRQLGIKFMPECKDKFYTIHNCIKDKPNDVIDWSTRKQSEMLRVVVVARWSPPKRNIAIMRALRAVLDKGARVHISFIGDGEELLKGKEVCNELHLNENVTFMGNRMDVHKLLPQFDVFLLYSNWEGFPISILEAMRAGLPIIASDVGGVKEIVDEDNGWLVENIDGQLIDVFMEISKSRNLLANKGENSRKQYLCNYTIEKMMDSMRFILDG